MGVYDIDFDEQVRQDLPVGLRKEKRRSWLQVLEFGVQTLWGEFMAFRGSNSGLGDTESVLYRLNHNSQVCSLEAALNDVFDSADRGIYITDGQWDDVIYLYLDMEERPVWLAMDSEGTFTDPYVAPAVLYTEAETTFAGVDFLIHVPHLVVVAGYNIERLKALVKRYKLAGKRFGIVEE